MSVCIHYTYVYCIWGFDYNFTDYKFKQPLSFTPLAIYVLTKTFVRMKS